MESKTVFLNFRVIPENLARHKCCSGSDVTAGRVGSGPHGKPRRAGGHQHEEGKFAPIRYLAHFGGRCLSFLLWHPGGEQKHLPLLVVTYLFCSMSSSKLSWLPVLTGEPTGLILEELCSGWDILSAQMFRKPGHWPSLMSLFFIHAGKLHAVNSSWIWALDEWDFIAPGGQGPCSSLSCGFALHGELCIPTTLGFKLGAWHKPEGVLGSDCKRH